MQARAKSEGFGSVASKSDMVAVYDWVCMSGGQTAHVWQELKAFARQYAQSNARKLPADQYAASAEYFR